MLSDSIRVAGFVSRLASSATGNVRRGASSARAGRSLVRELAAVLLLVRFTPTSLAARSGSSPRKNSPSADLVRTAPAQHPKQLKHRRRGFSTEGREKRHLGFKSLGCG